MVQFPKLDADKKLKISYAVYSYFVDNNHNYKLSFIPQEGLVESNKYDENKINAKLETFYKDVMEFLIRKSQQSKTPKKILCPITF